MIKLSAIGGLVIGTFLAVFILYFIGLNSLDELSAKVSAMLGFTISLVIYILWYSIKGAKVVG